MALTTYVYANKKSNILNLESEIILNNNITIGISSVGMSGNNTIVVMKDDLEAQSPDQKPFLDQVVNDHVYVDPNIELDYAIDKAGKLMTHQTLRMDGLITYFTGRGDDPTNPDDIGGGQQMIRDHKIGDPATESFYVDFNTVNNVSYIYEGYISYDKAHLDSISMIVVPRVVSTSAGTNTYYNLYGGYLIIPAAGDGVINLDSDITQSDGGLVYIPLNDDGSRSPAFWNAEWDDVNKVFTNITAAPDGNGEYNMFSVEVILNRFINEFHFTGVGTQELDSEDTDELGHGMRIKLMTETYGEDHDWSFTAAFTMHRERTI
jgi:hypothetical protein